MSQACVEEKEVVVETSKVVLTERWTNHTPQLLGGLVNSSRLCVTRCRLSKALDHVLIGHKMMAFDFGV